MSTKAEAEIKYVNAKVEDIKINTKKNSDKIFVEIIAGNGNNVISGNISIAIDDVEDITRKNGFTIIQFPGIIIKIPDSFCDRIHAVQKPLE